MPIEPASSVRTTIGSLAGGMPARSGAGITPGAFVSLNLTTRKLLATPGRDFVLTYNNPSGCIPPGLNETDLALLQIALDRGEIVLGERSVNPPVRHGLLEPVYEEVDKTSRLEDLKPLVFRIASRQKHLGGMTPAEALRYMIAHESASGCRPAFMNFMGSVMERTGGHSGVEEHPQDTTTVRLPADEAGKPIVDPRAARTPEQAATVASLI